jgi:hypothetical protein
VKEALSQGPAQEGSSGCSGPRRHFVQQAYGRVAALGPQRANTAATAATAAIAVTATAGTTAGAEMRRLHE